jgi:hypothetical protein
LKNCISNLKINADHFVLTDHHTNVLLNINTVIKHPSVTHVSVCI